MQSFVNSFPRSAEYISLYIDHKLRRSLSVASDALTDVTLNEILQIFRCDPPARRASHAACDQAHWAQDECAMICCFMRAVLSPVVR